MEILQKDLSTELKQLNDLIKSSFLSKEELSQEICSYLFEAGGKRIRPILIIVTSKIFNYEGTSNIKLASAVEFLHTATLLHDDVVDESTVRRFRPTANVVWGNKASILVGDFLLSQAFRLMVSSESIKSMESLSRASSIISQGEVAQLTKLKAREMISRDEYLEIIGAKTAELFAASCEVGAIIANQDSNICDILRNFGWIVGNIFQIIDDFFDYLGDVKHIGKNNGDDFFEGKVTLPLIMLYERLDSKSRKEIDLIIQSDNRTTEQFEYVKNLLVEHNIQDELFSYLYKIKIDATSCLSQIKIENLYKNHLLSILDFTINRSK